MERRPDPIAALDIEVRTAGGETFPIGVRIGAPYEAANGVWSCPVSLPGLFEDLADARGEDSYQALCLAIRLAQDLLQDVRDKGGELLTQGDAWPLEAYLAPQR